VFDVLKIDRAFVVNLPAEKSIAIVKAIVAVASALGKEVVAEGIESQLQLAQLSHLGCHFGQGYLLGKPLASQELMAMVLTRGQLRSTEWDELQLALDASGPDTRSPPRRVSRAR
jgi:EAL domain-containing protein (putative c-di-GMP-specific phosphodiesterase class I)